jgi:hypothetical protein
MWDCRARRRRIKNGWRWIYEVEEMEKSGGGEESEACLEDEWGGLDFGTGEEEQDDNQDVEH